VHLFNKKNFVKKGDVEFQTMRSMVKEVMEAFSGDYDLRSPGSG
jgi:hypothetical protein